MSSAPHAPYAATTSGMAHGGAAGGAAGGRRPWTGAAPHVDVLGGGFFGAAATAAPSASTSSTATPMAGGEGVGGRGRRSRATSLAEHGHELAHVPKYGAVDGAGSGDRGAGFEQFGSERVLTPVRCGWCLFVCAFVVTIVVLATHIPTNSKQVLYLPSNSTYLYSYNKVWYEQVEVAALQSEPIRVYRLSESPSMVPSRDVALHEHVPLDTGARRNFTFYLSADATYEVSWAFDDYVTLNYFVSQRDYELWRSGERVYHQEVKSSATTYGPSTVSFASYYYFVFQGNDDRGVNGTVDITLHTTQYGVDRGLVEHCVSTLCTFRFPFSYDRVYLVVDGGTPEHGEQFVRIEVKTKARYEVSLGVFLVVLVLCVLVVVALVRWHKRNKKRAKERRAATHAAVNVSPSDATPLLTR